MPWRILNLLNTVCETLPKAQQTKAFGTLYINMTSPIETSLQSSVNCKTFNEPDPKWLTHSCTHPVSGDTMYDEYFWVHSSKAICGRCGWSVSPVWMEEIYFQLRLSSGTNRSSELFLPLYKQTLQRKRKKPPCLIFSHSTILHIIFLLSACYAIFF